MAPGGGRHDKPKNAWVCSVCSKRARKDWRVSGQLNHCVHCDSPKGDVYAGDYPLLPPSVSRVHPPKGNGGGGNAWADRVVAAETKKADAAVKEAEAAKKELAALKKQQ